MTDADPAPDEAAPRKSRGRRLLFAFLRLAVAGVLLAWALSNVDPAELRATLAEADVALVAIGAGVLLCQLVSAMLRWHLLLVSQGIRLPLRRTIGLSWLGLFFNNLTLGLTGGDVVKAWYVSRDTAHRTKAVVTVLADRAVGLFGLAVLATAVAGIRLLSAAGDERENLVKAGLFLGLVLGAAIAGLTVAFSRRVRRWIRLESWVDRVPGGGVVRKLDVAVLAYRNHKLVLFAALGISIVTHAISVTAVACFGFALGLDVAVGEYFVWVPVVNIISSVPLAPAGWGVGEKAYEKAFGLLGVAATDAVTLSVTFRLITMLLSLPGWICLAVMRRHEGEPGDAEAAAADAEDATAGADAAEGETQAGGGDAESAS